MNEQNIREFLDYGYTPFDKAQCVKRAVSILPLGAAVIGTAVMGAALILFFNKKL